MSEELSLKEIEPGIAKLTEMAGAVRGLTIAGVDDVAGYKAVHDARMGLRAERVRIAKACKAIREKAVEFQKSVIAKEKEYIAIVEPTELELQGKEEAVDLEKARIKRAAAMPAREEKLRAIDAPYSYDLVIDLDDEAFSAYYNREHAISLQAKETAMRVEQERKDAEAKAEREAVEAKAKPDGGPAEAATKAEADRISTELRAEREKFEAEKRAADEEQAKKYAELKAEAERIEAQKRAIADLAVAEAKAKAEAERIEREKKVAAEPAVKQAKEKEEREKAETQRREEETRKRREEEHRYQEFLKSHGATAEGFASGEFITKEEGNTVTLYKRLGQLV